MSAPAARRLSIFSTHCAHCARLALRVAPRQQRQWQRGVGATSRRWYANDTRSSSTPQPRKTNTQAKRPKTEQDDVLKAAQEVVEEKQQQPSRASQVKTGQDVAASSQEATTDLGSAIDRLESPTAGDIPETVEEELPYGGSAKEQATLPLEDSTVRAADAEEAPATVERDTEPRPELPGTSSAPANSVKVEGFAGVNATAENASLGAEGKREADALPESTDAALQADAQYERVVQATSEGEATLPEGAVLESEEEEESLDDILGTADEDAQAQAIAAAMGSDGKAMIRGAEKGVSAAGFWNYAAAGKGDAEYLKNNVTSLGHDELEQQREYREYARLAAWELPLLSKLAKPFSPPTAQIPLRFRYTTYLGESHPAASKVVLEFSPNDLPDLTNVQKSKLIKLLGVRYNPDTATAKMSTESHTTQAQNKRHLLTLLNDLLTAAKDPADTFEDVPFDFRHHKGKKWHEFPKSWIVSEERLQGLVERRRAAAELEAQKREMGRLVDGKGVVNKVLQEPAREAERVIVNARTGQRVMPAGRR